MCAKIYAPDFVRDTARAMSQENVEIVRRSIELWSNADWDAFGTVYDPNVFPRAFARG